MMTGKKKYPCRLSKSSLALGSKPAERVNALVEQRLEVTHHLPLYKAPPIGFSLGCLKTLNRDGLEMSTKN